ncbi:50S ribosomal protein L25 [Candidatus Peregrinibacteria bacterium CG10_big_fil_rev_8_21_14_0_10_49_10]|nr:MAG: 50S ribosomal protein L25 [Candidatus Peregrinibacteria bacterium CG10_big_fil_rev_8_21_14_0_10_49_10]
MDMVTLAATARTKDVGANILRTASKVPCVLYGNNVENVSLECSFNDVWRAYQKAGENTIVELALGGRNVPVLFHEVQMDPVSDRLIHVDFYAVDMKKEIEAPIPIHFEGESLAVKDMGGVLVTSHDHVTVRCLPAHLPHHLIVSIAPLVDFLSTITVADIEVPEGVQIVDAPDVVIATAQEPRKEEELLPPTPAEGEVAEGAAAAVTGEEGEKSEAETGGEADDSDKDS